MLVLLQWVDLTWPESKTKNATIAEKSENIVVLSSFVFTEKKHGNVCWYANFEPLHVRFMSFDASKLLFPRLTSITIRMCAISAKT